MSDKVSRDAIEKDRAAKIETMKELRQRFGQSASDKDIERHVDERIKVAIQRTENGEAERGK